MKTQTYFQILCKQLEIQTFHSQASVLQMSSVEVGKDKRIKDNIKKIKSKRKKKKEKG